MSTNPMDAIQERRRHVRIDDDIVLFWQEVTPDEIPETLNTEESPAAFFPPATQIELLSLETEELLQRIGQDQPLLAEYLKILDRQVNILSRTLDENKPPHLPTQYVNLSASGLAFTTDEGLAQGGFLKLTIILPPSLTRIVAYGRIVDSFPNEEFEPESYSMGVDFIRIRECDREALKQHVARRQALFREEPMSH